ncbi:CoA-transferase [Enterovirga sp.]|jgi:glutaconate CoA-transferase subunit A|uniref:CoA transferase subunit A n=1 Tax=Enterovirga sp. TaxID=2026350 RepID=UPI002638CE9B|nr:CoA-transferase [Enterovirga sp.]MDB5591005.1 putative glutaconate CoA-transferase, subunit [Enterovirga sp.]
MARLVETLEDLVAPIRDGSVVALPPDYSGCAMAAIRALIGRRPRRLHLVGVPSLGFQGDMLIAAGAVAIVEAAAVGLGERGGAPHFERAIREGAIEMRDATCPAIHAGLQATERGVGSMPVAGILGSDLLLHRAADWIVAPDPFTGRPTVQVRAIRPDVALFHAAEADPAGNVWVGVRRELMTMAHASRRTLVTVERIVERDLLADDRTGAGTLPSLYVDAIALAPGGARPLGLRGEYGPDEADLSRYVAEARLAVGRRAA